MHVERYALAGELLAVRIGREPARDPGFHLVTEHADGLQVGRNRRPAGYVARAHVHTPPSTPTTGPRQEVLHVLSGRVRVDLFSREGARGPSVELAAGETLFLCAGHAVEFLEASETLEVKQGPYPGSPDADKRWLA